MKQRILPLTLAALGISLASSGALALDMSDYGPYVTGQYGVVSFDDSEFDEDDTAFKFAAGVDILPFLGIEAAYHELGDFETLGSSIEADGYSLAAVGRLPINDTFGIHAKIGQLYWQTEYDVAGFNGETEGNDLYYGVGATLAFNEYIDFILSYDRIKVDLNEDANFQDLDGDYDAEVNFASAGLRFSF